MVTPQDDRQSPLGDDLPHTVGDTGKGLRNVCWQNRNVAPIDDPPVSLLPLEVRLSGLWIVKACTTSTEPKRVLPNCARCETRPGLIWGALISRDTEYDDVGIDVGQLTH